MRSRLRTTNCWLRLAWALALALGCSRGSSSAPGDGGPPSRVAANGVPIPALAPIPPGEDCGALAVTVQACTSGCPQVTCQCGSTTVSFYNECFPDVCLASVSCTSACQASGDVDAATAAFICSVAGTCSEPKDCKQQPAYCVKNPGATHGRCTSGSGGEPCLRDADCEAGCVVGADGRGVCAAYADYAPCNVDAHCGSGSRCILAPGAFAGHCSNGGDGAVCNANADCQPLHVCQPLDRILVCSRRGTGSPCGRPSDCDSGFCVGGRCTDGVSGDPCRQASDCRLGHCPIDTCTVGNVGDICYRNADCATACTHMGLGVCTDGKVGEPCSAEPGAPVVCQPGLHCDFMSGAQHCAPAQPVGAACTRGSDCQSGVCGLSSPDIPVTVCLPTDAGATPG